MEKKGRRFGMCVIGVVVCGIAVGIFKLAAFGVDPFQTFMGGLNQMIPISFGTLYVIVNAILLLFSIFADRHYLGLATFVNLFLIGYIVDYSHVTLLALFPTIGIIGRIVAFLIGIILLCLGSAFYYVADWGVSTYDAVSLIIAHTWKKGQFKYIRITADFICVALGSALFLTAGGSISGLLAIAGVGTIITASCMGPLIDIFIKRIAQPFFDR
ncbi:MAG: hypothetical protein R3Y58_08985 [Eubacteriales bacterium]